MPNFSNNYNKETQKKCIDCGIVYNLAPEYEYSWIVDYGKLELKKYIKKYKDEGCPYCKKIKEEEIREFERRLKKCPVCGKAKIKVYTTDSYKDCYGISCDCVSTRAKFTYEWIPRLIGIWNKSH